MISSQHITYNAEKCEEANFSSLCVTRADVCSTAVDSRVLLSFACFKFVRKDA